MDVSIDLLCVLVNVLGVFTHSHCILVNIFTNLLCALANVLDVFTDFLCVLVCVLLYRRLSETLESARGRVGYTHLVIRHGGIQVADETVQSLGVISVVQELHDPMSLGKWSEFCNYIVQLPADRHCNLEK